jgi:1,3-beta-galactosyl-N-acetylhexosamine phosphorylase
VKEARLNWLCARRAIMRSPIDRIGYGGYLKLALDFPEFMDYTAAVCDEFRAFYDNVKGTAPFCFAKVAVLNCWGKSRSWGCHMVHHALYQKQNYSYAGVIEILSGAPYDVKFISFDDVLENPAILDDVDVILNIGGADTAHTGGGYWADERMITTIRKFIADGGGFIGVGEPSGHQRQGRTLQLASALGVEKENGFTLGYEKHNWDEKPHFITEEITDNSAVDFGEGTRGIYALEGAEVLVQRDKEVQLAAHTYFNGKTVYIGGLPYSAENARLLHRALLWSSGKESSLFCWFSANPHVDVHAYPQSGYCFVCNNSYEPQRTTVYKGDGSSLDFELKSGELRFLTC